MTDDIYEKDDIHELPFSGLGGNRNILEKTYLGRKYHRLQLSNCYYSFYLGNFAFERLVFFNKIVSCAL